MKKLKISLLALSVVAGGITVASAASSEINRSYQLFINSTNISKIWYLDSLPVPASGFPSIQQNVSLSTDSSGKIIGSGFIRLDFNTNNAPYSGYTVDVTGKATTKGNVADFSVKAKGPGGLVNGDGTAEPGSIDLKFAGGAPAIDPTFTNNLRIVGKLSGTIKGKSPLSGNNKTAKFSNVIAVDHNSGSYNPLSGVTIGVLQTEKKQQYFTEEFTGKGTIKNNTYKGKLKGIGFAKGASFDFNGTLGLYTNNISTNAISFVAPNTVEVTKGKFSGQSFQGVATRLLNEVNAFLVY